MIRNLRFLGDPTHDGHRHSQLRRSHRRGNGDRRRVGIFFFWYVHSVLLVVLTLVVVTTVMVPVSMTLTARILFPFGSIPAVPPSPSSSTNVESGLGLPFRIEDVTSVQCGQSKCLVQIRSSDGAGRETSTNSMLKFDRGYLIARIHFEKRYYYHDGDGGNDGKHQSSSSTGAGTRSYLDPGVRQLLAHSPSKILNKFNQTFAFEQELYNAAASTEVSTITNKTTSLDYKQTKPLLGGEPELVHVVVSSSNSSNSSNEVWNQDRQTAATETIRRREISHHELEELTDVMKRRATYIPRYRPRDGCKEIVDVTQFAVAERKLGASGGMTIDAMVVSPCKHDPLDVKEEMETPSSRIENATIRQRLHELWEKESDSVLNDVPLDLIVPLVVQPVHVVRKPNLLIKYSRKTSNFVALQKEFLRHMLFGNRNNNSNMQNNESARSMSKSSTSLPSTRSEPSSNNYDQEKVTEVAGKTFISNLKTGLGQLKLMLRRYPCLFDDLQFILDVHGYIHHIDLDRCNSIRSKQLPSLHIQDDIDKFIDKIYDHMIREVHELLLSSMNDRQKSN